MPATNCIRVKGPVGMEGPCDRHGGAHAPLESATLLLGARRPRAADGFHISGSIEWAARSSSG
eukprot:2180410-Prymnesium_polylepis.1